LRRGIELLDPNRAVAGVKRAVVGRVAVVHEPCVAVGVEEQRRIDAVEAEPDRIGPRAGGVRGGEEEVSPAVDHRAQQVERAVVKRERGREEPVRDARARVVDLPRPIDGVAELFPVHEIAARENRQAGEVREGGVDEEEIVADAAEARVRVEAGEDRIAEMIRRERRGESGVAAGVFEPVETDWFRRGGGARDRGGGEEEMFNHGLNGSRWSALSPTRFLRETTLKARWEQRAPP